MDPSTHPLRHVARLGRLLMAAGMAWMLSVALTAPTTSAADPSASPIPAAAGDPTAPVYVISATGVVDNVMAGYIEESVKRAADAASPAIIVTLNTPGGSLTPPSGSSPASSRRRCRRSCGSRRAVDGRPAPARSSPWPPTSPTWRPARTSARRRRSGSRWRRARGHHRRQGPQRRDRQHPGRSPRRAGGTSSGPSRPSRRPSRRRPAKRSPLGAVDGIAISLEDVRHQARRSGRRRSRPRPSSSTSRRPRSSTCR